MNILAEGTEEVRFETTKTVMEAMAKVAADPKENMENRIKATKMVIGMSEQIVKTYIMNSVVDADESKTHKLTKSLDKLSDIEKE